MPYYLSPFDTISLVRKEFRIAPEKLHECAENQLHYDTIVRATAVKGKYPWPKITLIWSRTPINGEK